MSKCKIMSIQTDYHHLLHASPISHIVPSICMCLYAVYVVSIISFTHTVLAFGDAQGDDDESSLPHMDHGFQSKLPPGILPHGLPTVQEVAPAITPQEKKGKDEKKPSKSIICRLHSDHDFELNH